MTQECAGFGNLIAVAIGSYSSFNSSAVELFAACTEGVFLTVAAMCMNLIVLAKIATSYIIFRH